MNIQKISGRDKALIFIAIPVVFIWAFYKFVFLDKAKIIPTIKKNMLTVREDITELEEDVNSIKEKIKKADELRVKIDAMKEELDNLKKDRGKRSARRLSSYLRSLTTVSHGKIRIVEANSIHHQKKRPKKEHGGINSYPLALEIKADFTDILEYFKDMETLQFPVSIDEVEINASAVSTEFEPGKGKTFECNTKLLLRIPALSF